MANNQQQVDYDRQFQADLERAAALSMETLALEEFKRKQRNGTTSQRNSITFEAQIRSHSSQLSSTAQEQRRKSEMMPSTSAGPDLISFSAPEMDSFTAEVAPKEQPVDKHSSFVQYVDQIHQMAAQQKNFLGNQPNFPSPFFRSPASLQLMPYTPPPQQAKQPLTPDQLQKLYNSPFYGSNSSSIYSAAPNYWHLSATPGMQHQQHYPRPPAAVPSPSPTVHGMAAPQYPMNQPYSYASSTNGSVYSQPPSSSGAAFPITGNVSNPESALVHVPKPPLQPTPTISQSSSAPSIAGYSASARRKSEKTMGDNLIDLEVLEQSLDKVSVLEAFDPLLTTNNDLYSDKAGEDTMSECTNSYYSEYDPFDYLYSGSGTQCSDPVYEAVTKAELMPMSPSTGAPPIGWNVPGFSGQSPPPLPPRNSTGSGPSTPTTPIDKRRLPTKLYENVIVKKSYDPELLAFYQMVLHVRKLYNHTDRATNQGHVVATEFETSYSGTTSIKLLVHPALESLLQDATRLSAELHRKSTIDGIALNNDLGQIPGYGPPVVFTCDINTTVEHVIMHAYCALENLIVGDVTDFALKPIGVVEWLAPDSKLSHLECIHNSIKLEKDVQLGLCPKTSKNLNAISRTLQDDLRDAELKPEDIIAHERCSSINYDTLMILLETLETEIDRLESAAADSNPHTVLTCSGVIQAVKAICALLGNIDTLDISEAIKEINHVCASGQTVYSYKDGNLSGNKMDIISEKGDYAEVSLRPRTMPEQIKYRCNQVRNAIQQLVEIYSTAFRVDFSVNINDYSSVKIPIDNIKESVMVHIMCVHRPPLSWKHDDYSLGVQICHGSRYIGAAVTTRCLNETGGGIYPRLTFNSWLTFDDIPVAMLPRESRLIFVLYGCTVEPQDGGNNNANASCIQTTDVDTSNVQGPNPNPERRVTNEELGWASVQFFDFERNMIQGNYLLSLWPPTTDKFLGPAPVNGTHPYGMDYPVLGIEIPNYGGKLVFPKATPKPTPSPRFDFNSLDYNLQQELFDTAQSGYSNALDKREVLWEKRHYLQQFPHALPKILHAAHSWDFASLVDIHAMLKDWSDLSPLQALELLLPRYPDLEVRKQAAIWVSAMKNDQLVDFLPQLLQALKHDTYEASAMAQLLLARSLESPRIAHHLYWLLVHSLPGENPQNSSDLGDVDKQLINQARYHRRFQMLLRALMATCGEKLSVRFLTQNMMCKTLADVAQNVKQAKESLKQKYLIQGMEQVHQILHERPTSLPLGPGLEVVGVNARGCSYFNSNTLPLKINFVGSDSACVPAIFKCGDDLQQDMLTLQLVRIMDKLWLKEGLDLKMVTFDCVPTGHKKGMIELVSDAETLRKIQVEWGLTGSFKDKPIAEWLAKQNPSQLEYKRAVDNFTASCAGYSVATYILGICDRHNDNIMLKTSGHLFHIDFGKFLGDAQMFGNFKRDRTPFVLTSDMAYVINGGDRPSTKFHHFVDLCCMAFNIVRRHGDLILHLLALMATSGIPGVTADAVTYVRNALLPGQSNPEAAASFAKMIHISLKSWFTQFNFFLHNLAQLRFSGDDGGGELLSFVPRTYTMAQDGRLKTVSVPSFQKRYDLEKYYTYIIQVTRQNQPDPAYLFRTYKEFSEFHQKLCIHFPLAKLHSLPSGIHVGRSNVKTVAERRLPEIRLFLKTLFKSADEIAHSDLVYTFFHPLLRDQQEADIHVAKVKETRPAANPTERVCGEIKLSLQYHRGALTLMVHHAKSLPISSNGQEPNTYVKAYLKPDPSKATKRKTKVVRKNCFPSFMETLEYRMSWEFIQSRKLQVTVWSHDSLQENEFLGGVELDLKRYDLRQEVSQWFPLGYLPFA